MMTQCLLVQEALENVSKGAIMTTEKIISLLESTSGTEEHKNILKSLSDDEIRATIETKFGDKPIHQKAILFQGYKKRQEA